MNVRRHLIPTAAATATVLTLGALTGCSAFEDDGAGDGRSGGRLDVVASFYPMAYLAEQIGADHVRVTNLTGPGQEPHDLEISAKQRGQIEKADAALYLKDLQPSVDEAIKQSGVRTKIDAASLTTLEKHGSEVGGHHDHGDHDHGDEHGHDHGGEGLDPHVWLDPVRYAKVAKGVGKALAKADPDHAADYRKNTSALVGKLDDLDGRYRAGLKNTERKTFITTHAAFGYLAERYGLTEEAISGLDPESEPSAARVRELQHLAKEDGATTVFYETLVSDKTAKTLAGDAHLRTDVLDPIEGITGKSRGQDYVQVMDANLKALQKALGSK
ncbi:metal ABC transporter substrate-binding protein [Streptomyces sp. NPDC058045]|uniref:metal ABC transporter substrate-binding protein n=1 Tax=Streptomyces sp. NPDC058045 TaxID=3346311 RepID=UPI0036E6C620